MMVNQNVMDHLIALFYCPRAHDADEKAMSEQKAANPKG